MKIYEIWIQFYQSHEWSSFSPPRRACSFVELLDLSNSRFIPSLSTFSCPFSTFFYHFYSFLFISCPIFCFRWKLDGPSHPDALRCILDSVRLGPPVTRQQGGFVTLTSENPAQADPVQRSQKPMHKQTLSTLFVIAIWNDTPALLKRSGSLEFSVFCLALGLGDLRFNELFHDHQHSSGSSSKWPGEPGVCIHGISRWHSVAHLLATVSILNPLGFICPLMVHLALGLLAASSLGAKRWGKMREVNACHVPFVKTCGVV